MKILYFLFFLILSIAPVMGDNIKNNIRAENYNLSFERNPSLRGPICSSEQMLEVLKYLKVFNVKNNHDLATSVIDIYGDGVWNEMVNLHPYLNVKDGGLDLKSAEWLMDSLLKIDSKYVKEIVVIFKKPTSGDFLGVFTKLLSSAIKGKLSNKLVFMSKENRDEFRLWLSTDFSKEEIAELYADDLVNLLPEIPYEILTSWGERFYHEVMTSDRYIAIDVHRSPEIISTIEIWGHGKAGLHGIVSANKEEKIMAPQIIKLLKDKGMIDNRTRVKLTACQGGCGISVKNLPFTLDKIKEMFQSGFLKQYLMQESKNSLIYAIRKEVSQQIPEHTAAVQGYLGENNSVLFDDTFHMNGKMKLSHAVSVYDSEGTEIHLNRFQMIYSLNPGDI